jgi:cobalt-zinc-cadmium efflux system outer membrane protein
MFFSRTLQRMRRGLAFAGMVCFLARSLTAQTPAAAVDALTLEQAVTEALDHNLGLLAERYNLSLAQARILTARLRPNPLFALSGDHLPFAGTKYTSANGAGPPEYAVRTDFILERGEKRRARIAVAEGARAVAGLQLLNAVRTTVLDVQSALVDLLLAKDSLRLAQENLATLNEIVRVNTVRVKGGDVSEVELLRAQVAALQFENQVRQAETRLATTRARLQVLLGRTRPARPFDVTGELRRPTAPLTEQILQEAAREQRPDLLALVRDQARSQAELRNQLAIGIVDYTVGAEFRRQNGLAGKGNSLGLFFQTNLPVFNRNQGEIERATQEQRQIEAKIRALQATVESEVEIAFLTYANARAAVEKIESSMLARARDVRSIIEYSYKRGEASFVEFLDAQRAYNDTIQSYNEARAEIARALYTIDAATGENVAGQKAVRP